MRDTDGTIAWYRANESWPGSIGFDPDGMCLKICRTARGLPSLYPSAVAAQEATPVEHRVHEVRDLRRGMILYYDDPRDSNPHGHIVTMVGRIAGADPDNLGHVLVRTNSVVANKIVVVRGDYFQRYWGDTFQFGATWLNGQAFPEFAKPAEKKKKAPKAQPPLRNAKALRHAVADLEVAIAFHRARKHHALAKALQADKKALEATIAEFS